MESSAIVLLMAVRAAVVGPPASEDKVEVFVDYKAEMPGPLMRTAQIHASRLLAGAGVRIVWRNGAPPPEASEVLRVYMAFVAVAPPEFRGRPRALGAAAPFTRGVRRITIFCDRLARFGDGLPGQAASVVGHVLAHELVHTLQGAATHSDRGLMRENWTQEDLATMIRRGLPMTGFDRQLVSLGISAWRRRSPLKDSPVE
jgi:hypothetical protein